MALTDVSTTGGEVIVRPLLWWLPLRLSKRQSVSSQTVLLRITLTWKIITYRPMPIWLLGSNHLQFYRTVSWALSNPITFLLFQWRLPEDKPFPILWLFTFVVAMTLNIASITKDGSQRCVSDPCIIFYVLGSAGALLGLAFFYHWLRKTVRYFAKWIALNQEWTLVGPENLRTQLGETNLAYSSKSLSDTGVTQEQIAWISGPIIGRFVQKSRRKLQKAVKLWGKALCRSGAKWLWSRRWKRQFMVCLTLVTNNRIHGLVDIRS